MIKSRYYIYTYNLQLLGDKVTILHMHIIIIYSYWVIKSQYYIYTYNLQLLGDKVTILHTVQITFIFIGQTHLDFGKRVCTCVTKHSNAFRIFWIGLRIRNAFCMNRNCTFRVCLFSHILICDLWAFGGFSFIQN